MKCEICHSRDAQTALPAADGGDDELYVCKECASKERVRRQQKSQRTRKRKGGPGVEITAIGGPIGEDGEPPPIIGAILEAVNGVVSGFERAQKEAEEAQSRAAAEKKVHSLALGRVAAAYRIGSRLHLEGLHLIGELDACRRAFRALGMELEGVTADGVKDAGHVFSVSYGDGSLERARRVLADLVAQERNARIRLFEEMPRVFDDSLCRALAILKNCRLLSPGEYFDLLSPLRLAAMEGRVEGIALKEIERLAGVLDLTGSEDRLEQAERDRIDAERADEVNARFEDVMIEDGSEG